MQPVHEVLEVVRIAVAAGGGVVTGHLVAPGAVVGVLGDGHELHMGVSHVAAVVRQRVRQIAVIDAALQILPGARMDLVNAHGSGHEVPPGASLQKIPVAPGVLFPAPDHGGVLAAGLRHGGKGVGFQHPAAVPGFHAVFIALQLPDVLQEHAPDAALQLFHGGVVPMPGVEIAHQIDAFGVGRPYQETVHLQLRDIVAAEGQPGFSGVAGVEEVNVVFRDKGYESFFHRTVLLCVFLSTLYYSAFFRQFQVLFRDTPKKSRQSASERLLPPGGGSAAHKGSRKTMPPSEAALPVADPFCAFCLSCLWKVLNFCSIA